MVTGGGEHFSKLLSIFYMLNSKNSFQPIFFNWYLSNVKTAFVDKSRVEPSFFFIERISFSLKLFSGHFYGQSFIKTARGPLFLLSYIYSYIRIDILIYLAVYLVLFFVFFLSIYRYFLSIFQLFV